MSECVSEQQDPAAVADLFKTYALQVAPAVVEGFEIYLRTKKELYTSDQYQAALDIVDSLRPRFYMDVSDKIGIPVTLLDEKVAYVFLEKCSRDYDSNHDIDTIIRPNCDPVRMSAMLGAIFDMLKRYQQLYYKIIQHPTFLEVFAPNVTLLPLQVDATLNNFYMTPESATRIGIRVRIADA